MSEQTKIEENEESTELEFADFLETTPPNQTKRIKNISKWATGTYGIGNYIQLPEIQLHCEDDICNGLRIFRVVPEIKLDLEREFYKYFYLIYKCSNCQNY